MTDPAVARDALFDPGEVRGLFDRMSRSYERMNVVASFGFSVRWRRQLMALVPPDVQAHRVLDAMSGMGETWSRLLRRFPRSEVAALDFSPRMVAHARERSRDRFGGRFHVYAEDMLDSGLPDASFDVVVSAFGLKTFDEEQSRRFADELARILRPGGAFAFVEVTEPPNPVLRRLYDCYLSRIIPIVGALLVSDPVEYRMLFRYLRAYGDGSRSERALAEHPALTVTRHELFFGCAVGFSGRRV
ncbi:class I SAM-dependent methyltransferase [Protaetiibacter intestinalis]|uniref:class I SAM-dependent methyltransferase n=1 Tax=Protaetiibacter intestinalis TaxID=2419774 RepID=UPI0013002E6E|nr:class I SAM-dependent methyltransferase [Protaetiibacter intestinalis]